jgi:hypothetical protein
LHGAALPLIALFSLAPAAAYAQRVATIVPPAVEVAAGVAYVGQETATRNATMTTAMPGDPAPLIFFRTSGKTRSGAVAALSIGANVSRSVGVEGGFQYSRPNLDIKVTDDVEGVPDLTLVASSFTQYVAEGNVVFHFNGARFDDRKTVPFVLVGGGILRQQDESGIEETGQLYQVGLGFKWFSGISPAGRAHGAGMRLDVRYVYRDGGFDFSDTKRRSLVVATATATVGF